MNKQPREKVTSITVKELADFLGCPFEGDGGIEIQGVASFHKAGNGDIVFLSHHKYRDLLDQSKASAAIVPVEEKFDKIPVIKSEDPYYSFIKTVELFYKSYKPELGIHSSAIVSPSVKIGADVSIGALAYIGDKAKIGERTVIFPLAAVYPGVVIGNDCVVYSHVSIRENIRIGNHVIIHCGAVIGADGFGYHRMKDGSYYKVPQKGTVNIEDDVEIGANTTIDRSALEETIIQKGTKIDNLVQIAHNVEVGPDSVIAAQTGIAGSTKLGKQVIMGGQVGVTDHAEIGNNVIAAAKTGITKSIPADTMVAGYPHLEIKEWRKAWASIQQLYDLKREVRRLKKKLNELEDKLK